jgi:L-lactate dehydrogenase complex protein LldG
LAQPEGKIVSDQATMLARIREALREPAPPRHLHGHGAVLDETRETLHGIQAWMPPVGATPEECFDVFQRNAAMLKAELVLYTDAADLQAKLQDQARRENWKKIATHRGRWSGPMVEALPLPRVVTDAGYAVGEIESCDVGLTECDALVAQTGSVLVTNRSAGGRVLSVLPPHHVVLARYDQLVPDLEAAFQVLRRRYSDDWPSFMSFITGPSRTGDIERILVLGAHGPKRLTIYCGQKSAAA